MAGLLAYWFGWRVPFIVFAVPTLIFVVLALRLQEPVRGAHERRAMGADEEAIATEEEPPSFAEGWRMVWKIETLRRHLVRPAVPRRRRSSASCRWPRCSTRRCSTSTSGPGLRRRSVEPFQLVGLIVGARIGTQLVATDPGLILRLPGPGRRLVVAGLPRGVRPRRTSGVAIVANAIITGALAMLAPGILAALSLAIPPRARSIGFSVASLWVIPGLLVLPIIGAIGDRWGIRWGMLVMVPIFLVGGLIIASAPAT